jgi:hypothetical protein
MIPASGLSDEARDVADRDHPFRRWIFRRAQGPSAEELIDRAQELADNPRPHSLEWCVEASHVGDLNAIAIAALRAPIQLPTGARARNGHRGHEG